MMPLLTVSSGTKSFLPKTNLNNSDTLVKVYY